MKISVTYCVLLLSLAVNPAPSAHASEDEADKKTIKRILQGIEAVPSLYARGEKSMKIKSLPKFSALKLVSYPVGKKQSPEEERERYKEDRDKYVKEYPLRAAMWDAVEALEVAQKLDLSLTLPVAIVSPKGKLAVLKKQEPVGMAIFKLEQALMKMQEVAGQRDKEMSKRWQADFDFATARVQANLLYLFEYSYVLGLIRVDKLPPLAEGSEGWQVAFRPKINVPESKPKQMAKERLRLLKKMQEDYAATPWAYFAERESRRDVGMEWVAKK